MGGFVVWWTRVRFGLWMAVAAGPAAAAGSPALCGAGVTDDALRPLPVQAAPEVARAFRLTAAPDEVARIALYRCDGGHALACIYAATLPCAKADTRPVNPNAAAYCAAHPEGDMLPVRVAGRGSAFAWRCDDGQAIKGRARPLDARGFFPAFWKRID